MIVLLGAIMVMPASAKTWYVDDDGGYDFTTIQDAINAASDGDMVFVYNGTYGGRVSIRTPNITVKGEGADVVTYVGGPESYHKIVIGDAGEDASGCILEGFTLKQRGSELGGDLVKPYAPNCIIRNCVFEGLVKGIGLAGCNTTFENNVVLNAANDAIAVSGVSSCKIVNNTIEGTGNAAIVISDPAGTNNVITRNNISSNGIGVGFLVAVPATRCISMTSLTTL